MPKKGDTEFRFGVRVIYDSLDWVFADDETVARIEQELAAQGQPSEAAGGAAGPQPVPVASSRVGESGGVVIGREGPLAQGPPVRPAWWDDGLFGSWEDLLALIRDPNQRKTGQTAFDEAQAFAEAMGLITEDVEEPPDGGHGFSRDEAEANLIPGYRLKYLGSGRWDIEPIPNVITNETEAITAAAQAGKVPVRLDDGTFVLVAPDDPAQPLPPLKFTTQAAAQEAVEALGPGWRVGVSGGFFVPERSPIQAEGPRRSLDQTISQLAIDGRYDEARALDTIRDRIEAADQTLTPFDILQFAVGFAQSGEELTQLIGAISDLNAQQALPLPAVQQAAAQADPLQGIQPGGGRQTAALEAAAGPFAGGPVEGPESADPGRRIGAPPGGRGGGQARAVPNNEFLAGIQAQGGVEEALDALRAPDGNLPITDAHIDEWARRQGLTEEEIAIVKAQFRANALPQADRESLQMLADEQTRVQVFDEIRAEELERFERLEEDRAATARAGPDRLAGIEFGRQEADGVTTTVTGRPKVRGIGDGGIGFDRVTGGASQEDLDRINRENQAAFERAPAARLTARDEEGNLVQLTPEDFVATTPRSTFSIANATPETVRALQGNSPEQKANRAAEEARQRATASPTGQLTTAVGSILDERRKAKPKPTPFRRVRVIS